MAPEVQAGMQLRCPRCGQVMRPDMVRTAIWREERLVVVEDIPAQVCDACMEQFYDDDTTDALRRLMEDGFPPDAAGRTIEVPIFSLQSRIVKRGPAPANPEDVQTDW